MNHARFISIIDAEINLGFSLQDCLAVHVHLPDESLVVLGLSTVLLKLFDEQFQCMKSRQVTTLYMWYELLVVEIGETYSFDDYKNIHTCIVIKLGPG